MLQSISNTCYLPGEGVGILMVFSEDRAWPKDDGRTQDKRHSFSHKTNLDRWITFFRPVCFLCFAASGVEIPDRGPYCEMLDFLQARY